MKTSLSLMSVAMMSCMTIGGCALLPSPGPIAPDTAAPARMPSDLEQARNAFVRGNYGIAIRHLELALAQQPASVAALNGLGASYDRLGRHDIALRYYFRALALAPDSALTLGNLGLSYILQGRSAEALGYLELALVHQPDNVAARENYSRALAMAAPKPPPLPLPRIAEAEAPTVEPVLPASVRIEISNGNGINGMAALVRASLQTHGANVVRLTNADSYAYASTRVYYRAGLHEAALALAARFPGTRVLLEESAALAERVDLRLLVGRDLDPNVVTEQSAMRLAQHVTH